MGVDFARVILVIASLTATYVLASLLSKGLDKFFERTPFPEDIEKLIVRSSKYLTRIVCECNLNFGQLSHYLKFISFRNLVRSDVKKEAIFYKTTGRGRSFLDNYGNTVRLLAVGKTERKSNWRISRARNRLKEGNQLVSGKQHFPSDNI
jgi:predicted transcriptional regulator